MHGTSQGTPVPLTTFGGLATIADPNSLPQGASPRTYDTDFDVGSVFTRSGLTNAYTYAGASVGPNGGSVATGPQWTNPDNILLNDGNYTSIAFGKTIGGKPGPPLDVTAFSFSLPATDSITGVQVSLTGYGNAPGLANMSLTLNGIAIGQIKSVAFGTSPSTITFGSLGDSWGAMLSAANVNNTTFGVQLYLSSAFVGGTGFFDYVSVEVGVATGASNYNFITTFTAQDGTVRNLAQDASGNLWQENVSTNPGVLSLALSGVTPNSYCTGANGPDVEYLSFSDLTTGSDIPRQYTSQWIDRISQVGPGASPVFSATQTGSTSYNITSIVQPAAKSWGFAFLLQSAGPGSNTPGNTVTVYYADSTLVGPDTDLTGTFANGLPMYVYCHFTASTGGDTVGALTTPFVALVTSAPTTPAKPNGQSRPFYYFTFQVANTAFVWNPGQNGAAVTYQRSMATLTMAQAVPQLTVGENVVITGNSVSAWDATWPIAANFNSGAMAITQTALSTAGVGTYSYSVVTGANPAAGQLVTVTGTLNANGALNVTNVPIATVTGTSTGTFTVNLLPAGVNFPAEAENGQATTAGTLFGIDPGAPLVGSATNPILGNGSGGSLIVESSQVISSGTRQGVVGFITRNGYWTAPGPPVVFNTPENTTNIAAANIPIGPPNVIGRYIAFTEAGQNNVPGANFFVIPTNTTYYALDKTFTATATIIWDNTTTSASFTFIDDVLLNAEAIDVQGNNLFNLIEIGNPGWITQYASRNFYGLCQNKIQNFNNMSFDGGFLNPANPQPLGWTKTDTYGELLISPVFGNSYYIQNTSGTTIPGGIGFISQSAYQDAYQQPILQPNTTYSVRVTARAPGGPAGGELVVYLSQGSGGPKLAAALFPLGALTTEMATYTTVLLTQGLPTVPTNATLSVFLQATTAAADCEIDRIEIFPTEIPVLSTTVYGSYANDFESVDAVTGNVEFISENQQPCTNAFVLYDTMYVNKASSKYSLKSSPNFEPAQWSIAEVSQKAGSIGIMSSDSGEQWEVSACRNGLYLYEGGQPGRIMPEIYQIWNAINWSAGNSIWIKNDVPNSRLFIGIPLPTPNFWLPNAPLNTNPTTPNVILMCNYKGVANGEGIKGEAAVHVTMFGTLEAGDMRRKWSLWNIASPYASFVQTAQDQQLYICNGVGNSKIYKLDPNSDTDDGAAINWLYTTFGFLNLEKAAQFPGLGMVRKLWGYMRMTMTNLATVAVTLYGDTLIGPNDVAPEYNTFTVPGGFLPLEFATRDRECTLNFQATRAFVEFSGTDDWKLTSLLLEGKKNPWNQVTGQK